MARAGKQLERAFYEGAFGVRRVATAEKRCSRPEWPVITAPIAALSSGKRTFFAL